MVSLPFPMRSSLILALLVQLAACSNSKAYDLIPYISLGLKIGWDSNRGFTMGPKIGFGVLRLNDEIFINLTIGAKSFQNLTTKSDQFIFVDIQIGSASISEFIIPYGAGVGLLFGREGSDFKVSPRTTVFVGFILFPTIDFNFWFEDRISYEPGFELTLPILLRRIDWGFE